MTVYSGIIEKLGRVKVHRVSGVNYIGFQMNMKMPTLFFAWEDGTEGYDILLTLKKGDALEVEATVIADGTNRARASVICIADRELVFDKTLAQQALEEIGHDTLF